MLIPHRLPSRIGPAACIVVLAAMLAAGCSTALALDTARPLKQYGRQSWQTDTGLPQNTVHAVTQTPDGFIWMATDGGLVRFDGLDFRVFDTGSQRELPAEIRQFAREALAAEVPGGRVELKMPNGDLWTGTDKGLQLTSHGVARLVRAHSSITAARVQRIFEDREGALWVAYDLGVARVVDSVMQEPIDIAGVLSIFEDREGDMWFGTDVGGATVLRQQAFSTITTADGLSDDFVRAIFQDQAGTVWLGTNRGGLNRIADGRITAMRAGPAGLSSNVVLALAESAGDLWIGTPDGLSRLREGRLTLFTTADGLPDDFVRSLYTDRDGSLWIGTRNGLSHFADGRFTSYSRLDGLGGDLIGSILRAKNGALWVGTFGGLSRFDGTGFRNYTTKDGLAGDAITALAEDQDGTLWVAAHGAALTRLRPGDIPRLVADWGPGPATEIYSILEVATPGDPSRSSLWLGSSKGVFRIPLDALNASLDRHAPAPRIELFGTADGMKISECSSGGHPAAWRMADGTLWFATLKGAAFSNPASAYEHHLAPLTAIEEISIDDSSQDVHPAPQDHIFTIPPGRERITIHYAGLSFRAPQKTRFRYKLEGFDHDWVYAGARRTAFYTNLPAGGYRFVVVASTGDGIWSEMPGELRFTIRPHFYRTIWFYCLVLSLVALLAWLIYRARVRTVEAQYGAVLAERNRIAREIHDTLAQGYVGISVQLELLTRMLHVSKDGAEQQLERTKELVRSSLAEARSSIWNLRATSTGEAGTLPARLAAVVRARQREATVPVRFEVQGSFRPVEGPVEDHLLRIAQEAISNAVRHAEASEIRVALGYDTVWLTLTIADDGRGFPRAAVAPGHYGLQGIEERAAEIGAKLTIESGSGAGTTVKIALALSTGREVERA